MRSARWSLPSVLAAALCVPGSSFATSSNVASQLASGTSQGWLGEVGGLLTVTGRVSTVQEDDFANGVCRRHTVLRLDERGRRTVGGSRSVTFPATKMTDCLAHGGEATLTLRMGENNTVVPTELHEFTRARRGFGAFDEVGTGNGASVPDTRAMNSNVPNRSVLLLRVAYNGVDPTYCDVACASNVFWGSDTSGQAFLEEQSERTLTFKPEDGRVATVTLTGTLDAEARCPFIELADAADLGALSQHGIIVGEYSHVVYYVPHGFGTCIFDGLGVVACPPGDGCRIWLREASPQTLMHEIGHNFGMHHAAVDADNDGWAESEFGDLSGIMAGGFDLWRGFNAPHRIAMGWVHGVREFVGDECGSHLITLSSLSLASPPADAVRVIQIPRNDLPGYVYTISLRTSAGFDAVLDQSAPGFVDRVAVHHIGLVEAHHSSFVTALPMGATASLGGWDLEVISIGAHSASVLLVFCDERIALPPVFPAPPATCAELGWPISFHNPQPICGESEVLETCHRDVTHATAGQVCASVGARLCTADELGGDAARDTGCQLDTQYIWTSTACTDSAQEPGSIVRMGRAIGGDEPELAVQFAPYCAPHTTGTAAVRCCSEDPTQPPTPPPTGLPTPIPCPDLLSGDRCASFEAKGYCDHPTLSDYVRENCEHTCGVECVPKPPQQGVSYVIASSAEGCNDAFGLLAPITSRADCQAAARALSLDMDVAARINSSEVPGGCYYLQQDVGSPRRLWFNLYTGQTTPADGEDRLALCVLVGR